ncbi:hypothetical protein GGR50DRAFT_699098, partial [Xylaria sp. CBS 124048]
LALSLRFSHVPVTKANIPLIWKPKLAGHTVDNNNKINGNSKNVNATPICLSPTIDNNVIDPIVKPTKPADTTPTSLAPTVNKLAVKPSIPIDNPKIEESIVQVVAQIQTANELAVKTALAVTPQTTTSITGNQAKPLTSARNLVTTIASVLIAKLTQNGKHYTDTSPRRNIQNVPGNIAGTPKHTISEWLFRPPPQPPPSSSPTLNRNSTPYSMRPPNNTSSSRN